MIWQMVSVGHGVLIANPRKRAESYSKIIIKLSFIIYRESEINIPLSD
jgi:hypothetical protein